MFKHNHGNQSPADWPIKKIGWLFDMIGSGTTPDSNRPEFYENGVMPWVNTAELRDGVIEKTQKYVTEEALSTFRALTVFPIGTLLIALYGATIGRLGIINIEATTNQACCGMAFPKGITVQFLFYWLLSQRENIIVLASGGGQPNISQETVKQLRLAVPPVQEQQKIVAFLDRETARLDELRQEKEQFLELLELKRASLISHAVTRGLSKEALLKPSGIEWLGDVPEHWTVSPMKYRYQVQLGKMLDASRITGKHLAPYLRNIDVQWGEINTEDLPTMDFSDEDREKFSLKVGDLLVCEGGEIGRCAFWNGEIEECYYQKALHRVRPWSKSSDSATWLYFVMWSAAYQGIFSIDSNGSTIEHLPAEKLRQYKFPFPPLSEQLAIVAHLEQALGEIDELKAAILDSLELLSQRRAALIAEAVTGKLQVTGSL